MEVDPQALSSEQAAKVRRDAWEWYRQPSPLLEWLRQRNAKIGSLDDEKGSNVPDPISLDQS